MFKKLSDFLSATTRCTDLNLYVVLKTLDIEEDWEMDNLKEKALITSEHKDINNISFHKLAFLNYLDSENKIK